MALAVGGGAPVGGPQGPPVGDFVGVDQPLEIVSLTAPSPEIREYVEAVNWASVVHELPVPPNWQGAAFEWQALR